MSDRSNQDPRRRRRLRRTVGLAVAGAATCGAVLMASNAGAADHKVSLCHATDSTTNPYVLITVDFHSITLEGHGGHTGPVYAEGIEGKWGDVIPAFDFGGSNTFPGQNLDEAGQALLAGGCTTAPLPTTTTSTIIEG